MAQKFEAHRNAKKPREALRPFAEAIRKTTRGAGAHGTRGRGSGGAPDTAKIRIWVKENGYAVSDRGRVHQTVRDAYNAHY